MRFILDANVWISYLLARDESNTIRQLVGVCMDSAHTIITPPELLHELRASVGKYPHLRKRITQAQVELLTQAILEIALQPDSLQRELSQMSRDPKDDYLIAYALVYRADYLVTGDEDLLVLGAMEQLQIVRPAQMRRILEAQGLWGIS